MVYETKNPKKKNLTDMQDYAFRNTNNSYSQEQERQKIIDSYEQEQKEKNRYNGWSNFLTWQVALNIDNDQYFQEEVTQKVGENEIKNGYELKEWFKEELESSDNYNEDYNVYKLSDSWTNRELEDVDWNELYSTYKRNYEEEKKYKERNEY